MNSAFSTPHKPGTRRSLAGVLALLLVLGMLALLALPAAADTRPLTPLMFWGDVTINGVQASTSDTVEGKIGGVTKFSTNVDSSGRYGWNPLCTIAREGLPQPSTVEFYVNGIHVVGADYTYASSTDIGGVVDLNLLTGDNHNLTVNSDGCCTVTVGALGTVPAGGTQTFSVANGSVIELTANAGACCQFTSWTGPVSNTGNPSTTVTVNADVTVEANGTALGPYTLTTNTVGSGSVNGSGSYNCGQTATVSATAATGWTFTGWGGDLSGITNPTTIVMNGNKTVTANFAQNVSNLTVQSNGCCTITVGTLGTVLAGGSQTFSVANGSVINLTANAGTCCQFTSWTGPVSNTGNPSTTVTVNSAVTVVANCSAPGPYTLTTGANPSEGGSVTGGGSYTCGQTANVTAVPNQGYVFTGWSGDLGGTTNPTTIVMSGNKSVIANFATDPSDYTLTITSSAGGSVVAPGEGTFTFTAGTTVPLLADPDGYCTFSNWTGDVANATAATTTILMDGNKVISAVFTCPEPLLEIPLVQGWNTFSVPIALAPFMDTWGEFKSFSSLSVMVAYSYNAETQSWEQVLDGTLLKPLDGFYVKMNAGGLAKIIPNPDLTAPPVKHLKVGMNLIGVCAPTDIGVVDYLVGISGKYSQVLNPPINVPNDWLNNYYAAGAPNPPTMEIGKAYWVNISAPIDLYGLWSTPLMPMP